MKSQLKVLDMTDKHTSFSVEKFIEKWNIDGDAFSIGPQWNDGITIFVWLISIFFWVINFNIWFVWGDKNAYIVINNEMAAVQYASV